jgi:TRAP transporter TAXI family solute receptor
MNKSNYKSSLKIAISLLFIVAVSIMIIISLMDPFISKTAPLRMSAGSSEGKRHEIAKTIVNVARKKGLEIDNPVSTEGSVETIKRVVEGELDLGLIQGGLLKYLEDQELQSILGDKFIKKDGLLKLRQVDTLDIEPLHMLFKPSIMEEGVREIRDLSGKRKILNLSEKGSGTHLLALQLLKFVRLKPETDYIEKNLSYRELKELAYDKLPDAVFTVSLLRSPIAQYLIEERGYRLVGIPYGKSLSIDNTGIKPANIDKYIYSSQTEAVETIGTTLLLVTNTEVSDENVERLLETTKDVEFNLIVNRIQVPEQTPEYPLHPGVAKFASKNEPIFTREVLRSKYAINGALFLILIALIVNLRYAWSKRRSEQEHIKQLVVYSDYRKKVSDLEQELNRLSSENTEEYVAKLERLRRDLIEIRNKANNDFYTVEFVDPAISDQFQRYINSVISSVESILNSIRSR